MKFVNNNSDIFSSSHKPEPQKAGFLQSLTGLLAGACFLGFMILGFAGETVLSDGMMWILPALFGAMFLFAGLSVGLGGQKTGFIFGGVGAVITSVTLIYAFGGPDLRAVFMNRILPCLLLGVFIIAGLGFMIIPPIRIKQKANLHTMEVQATVIAKHERIHRDRDGHRHRIWSLDWKYNAGGHTRTYCSRIGRRPEPRVPGDQGILYLNPSDLNDVWEAPSRMDMIMPFVLGILFFIVGTGSLAMFLFFC